jgi:hypothetical protein
MARKEEEIDVIGDFPNAVNQSKVRENDINLLLV